ncbi:NERD domain-containing protein [Rhodopirellula europaea]|uniref:DNA 3'-5' helicase II n=1 Tax=Rhodopirellula europaea 6C TaxID=1263867 RepID=M2B1F6_9BACT|nr:NERD domain-containing protein [Rhodopirellula europaea]EMB16039.1 NERD domain-containing protein [Rhodopirellula europaea 6C]
MAIMRPDIDPDDIPYDSERLVYSALKEQLGNDFVVLHSYPWLRPDRDGKLREGEADFIVLHQEKGMLILEVKGGELRYQNATWQRKKSHGYEPITDPFKQARGSMHYLVDRIEKQTAGDVRGHHFSYGHAVVFPHDNYTGAIPPGADESLVLSRRQMESMDVAIEAAMASWPQRSSPLSNHQWNRLATALLPEFKLFRPIVGSANDVFEKIQEMTDEQIELLSGLYDDNNRVFVTGVAGSGKTQLAFDRAVHLAKDGKRTLFVCYNRHLAAHLRCSLDQHPDGTQLKKRLKISHFHQLAREIVEDAGVDWDPPETFPAGSNFFIDDVPDLVEQAAYLAMEEGEDVQYDAIVIDEAQDFHSRWWEVLQCTLLKEAEEGTLFAFSDPIQRLWDWAPKTPPVAFQTKYNLRRNCRNSRWIARTSTTIAKTEAKFFKRSPLGGKPDISTVPTLAAMKGIVCKAVENLLQQHDIKPSQMALIGPRGFANGSLADVSTIAGVDLTNDTRIWNRGDGILVTTARSFKGLEADVVIVYDLDGISKGFSHVDLYVACTRARSHVHFLVTGKEMLSDIKAAIQNAEKELA